MQSVDEDVPLDDGQSSDSLRITVHRSCPDRAVFVESGNDDAWIGTDLTVTPEL